MQLAPGKLQIHGLKIVKSTLSVHSTNAIQTAAVTIISYKPLSDLNFARYTIMYGSYMPSPPFGVYMPLVIVIEYDIVCSIYIHSLRVSI